jgi:hypothetical protein
MAAMAERDPFGRLPDENPLAGLGALSDGTQAQAAEPVVTPNRDWSGSEPAAKAKPAASEAKSTTSASWSSPPKVPRTGNPMVDQSLAEVIRQAEAVSGVKVVQSVRVVSRVVKLVVFLVVIGVIASVAGPIIDVGKDVRDAVDDIPSTGGLPGGSASEDEAPPVGLSSKSFLRRATFDSAMKRLRTSGLGRMQSLTIRPERLSIQLLTKGGTLRSLQMRFDEAAIDTLGPGTPGLSHLETVPFARLDTAAPQRLARSAAGRARLPVSRVDYVTLNISQGEVSWGAYLKGGKIYLANSRGRITRRIS